MLLLLVVVVVVVGVVVGVTAGAAGGGLAVTAGYMHPLCSTGIIRDRSMPSSATRYEMTIYQGFFSRKEKDVAADRSFCEQVGNTFSHGCASYKIIMNYYK